MPERIRVGPHIYRVAADEAKVRAFEQDQRCCAHGYSDHMRSEIFVTPAGPNSSRCEQRDTLWHEVKHCVVHVVGGLEKGATEETIVSRTGPMELAVLRENPQLVDYLLADDDGAAG